MVTSDMDFIERGAWARLIFPDGNAILPSKCDPFLSLLNTSWWAGGSAKRWRNRIAHLRPHSALQNKTNKQFERCHDGS